jgi:prolyl 4-hydroxylase
MKFGNIIKKLNKSWIYIALVLLIFSALYWWFFIRDKESFLDGILSVKGRGFSDTNAEYIEPAVHKNFITESEAKYILNQASSQYSESKIVSGSDTNIRKSQTAWLPKTDDVVGNIIRRVCKIANLPFENSEKMQVVKYQPDGYYNEHHDACCDDRQDCVDFEKNGGQRKITMLLYLSDDFEGGGTRFPNLNKEYKPPKYSGLLFHPLEKNGNKCHPKALHAGLPVKSGEKYIANIWIRERAYDTG